MSQMGKNALSGSVHAVTFYRILRVRLNSEHNRKKIYNISLIKEVSKNIDLLNNTSLLAFDSNN